MLYDIHNVSDLTSYARTVVVSHIPVPVGGSITLPGPLPRELSRSHELTGLLVLAHGESLPAWVTVGRIPIPVAKAVVPEVEVVVSTELVVDYSEFRVSEMAQLYKEVTGGTYQGRRRRIDLIEALTALDQNDVLEAIG